MFSCPNHDENILPQSLYKVTASHPKDAIPRIVLLGSHPYLPEECLSPLSLSSEPYLSSTGPRILRPRPCALNSQLNAVVITLSLAGPLRNPQGQGRLLEQRELAWAIRIWAWGKVLAFRDIVLYNTVSIYIYICTHFILIIPYCTKIYYGILYFTITCYILLYLLLLQSLSLGSGIRLRFEGIETKAWTLRASKSKLGLSSKVLSNIV